MTAKKNILIIGGGISGITTAVEAAEVGANVHLIEKLPYLGGQVVKMNRYFPKLCPPYCGLEINFRRIKQNSRIQVHTSTVVNKITGTKGNFIVTLRSEPEFVNNNCTLCGECEKVCETERLNEFNFNMDKTKAIYFPHEMVFPYKYVIDGSVCAGKDCNKCTEVCKYNAIDLKRKSFAFELKVDSIVIATGWEPYNALKIDNLLFGKNPDIITNVMMERLAAPNGPTKGKILKPSNGKPPKSVVFVHCAGSRDENHLSYCSGVCCSASLKQALYITEQYPESKIKNFYIDMRVSGRNEDFLSKVKAEKNIELIMGKVARIKENSDNGSLIVEAEDVLSGKIRIEETEMVVLATGIVPSRLELKNIKYDDSGFIINEMLEDGIYAIACSKKPLDVSASLKDATGMALKAIQS
ncbi:MAG: FAD-dependent oxidoreductase [Bacteroidales bacterium]|nr:FAD-dependent oxidoreductase [Bacteroidales bacterium]